MGQGAFLKPRTRQDFRLWLIWDVVLLLTWTWNVVWADVWPVLRWLEGITAVFYACVVVRGHLLEYLRAAPPTRR